MMNLTDPAKEAQHIIPYGVCETHSAIAKAINEQFHPNDLINGLAVFKNRANGKVFHGNHPAYDDYVKKKLDEIEDFTPLEIKNYLQDILIPDLTTKINQAWNDASQRGLNDFFKEQGWIGL